ncbi:MAG: AAA family ATPase [Candidatus Poribacteria bacterium]|nr:AAA family ATPase [Candidatus Poribacteria bacterium]
MSGRKAFLEKIHIKNYLSLRDVTLPFKPLTVLVGPNASGKTNALAALLHLRMTIVHEEFASGEFKRASLWAGEAQKTSFHLQTKIEENRTRYHLEIKPKPDFSYFSEQLLVNDVKVISIQDGYGVIRDEHGENETPYNSNKPALGSAGNYGNKPITRSLAEFMRGWKFYDFSTDIIRNSLMAFSHEEKEIRESSKLEILGKELPEVLWNLHKNSPENFRNVSDSLATSTNRKIGYCPIDGQNQLCLLEGYKNPIPLHSASDGILRLITYNTLLNEPELPPFIAIEEPERNLHPGALSDIAHVLEQIAKYSQVIITTHSSQLLGAFNSASLSDSLGVLLLRNRPGFGTEALNLEDYRAKKKALDGWIADFGIGSAVFDSGLLPDEMEGTSECQA